MYYTFCVFYCVVLHCNAATLHPPFGSLSFSPLSTSFSSLLLFLCLSYSPFLSPSLLLSFLLSLPSFFLLLSFLFHFFAPLLHFLPTSSPSSLSLTPYFYSLLPSPPHPCPSPLILRSPRRPDTGKLDIDDEEVEDEVEEEISSEIEIETGDDYTGRPVGPIIRVKNNRTQP